jgi:soluble lytic murein transglycosylase-like protein
LLHEVGKDLSAGSTRECGEGAGARLPSNARHLRSLDSALRGDVRGTGVELVEAIIDEESGWNPYAVSSKGAAGIMQLMPGTAVRFGVHNRFRVDENIHCGVAYLAWLNQKFSGDLRLITAAYYVGEYPISLRGLDYSSPDVQAYVKRIARRYRARQQQKCSWQSRGRN